MKYIGLFWAVCFLVSCGSGERTVIKGRLNGQTEGMLYLEQVGVSENSIVDSLELDRRGDFKFKLKLDPEPPRFYNIRYGSNYIPLLIRGGDRVDVRAVGSISTSYSVTGSPESELLRALNTDMTQSLSTMDSLRQAYQVASTDSLKQHLSRAYVQTFIKIKREYISFVIDHSNSLVAVYALYQRMPDGNRMFEDPDDLVYYKIAADSLRQRYPSSPHVLALMKDVKTVESFLGMNRLLNSNIGKESNYPDLELPDMYGNKIRLSMVNNATVVLLDFWAAENSESRLINREFLEVYDRYHPQGFEIYQVSMDQSKPLWINTVQSQNLPWVSVCDFKGSNSPAARMYSIRRLPSNFLINQKGEIIGKDLYGEDLEKKLSQLF